MALIRPFQGKSPKLGAGVFLADNVTVIGDVVLEDGVNVWYGAVLRGDMGKIRIGPRTNVQDLACVHMTSDLSDAILGADITVGHGAIVHGAVVEDGALIGMGAILLDNARIGECSVVAAGALVPGGMVVPPGTLVRGQPARVVRELREAELAMGREGAAHYLELAREHAREQAR
jgi:carbonic anhydrase/acetyltransferase-like protein (isoleucine patch superfamily)